MKALDWFNKYGIIVIICLLALILMGTCSSNNNAKKALKVSEKIYTKLDSINISLKTAYIVSSEELRLMNEIQKLQTVKQVLYDWNSVVRTVVRPDDRMNYYDLEIKKLEDQLNQLRANKLLKDK